MIYIHDYCKCHMTTVSARDL